MLHTKRYNVNPETVEAIQLGSSAWAEVAQWCGGNVVEEGILVPTLAGNVDVVSSDYVVRDVATGRFRVMDELQFQDKYSEHNSRLVAGRIYSREQLY